MNCEYPGLCRQLDIDHGIHYIGENKVQSMKWKSKKIIHSSTIKLCSYFYSKNMAYFEAGHLIKHKPLISEVWVLNAHYINSSSESGARIFSAPEKEK